MGNATRHGSLLLALLLAACTSVPKGLTPVRGFEIDRFLGHWYQIARLDHRFERGLTHVTAEYSLRSDGRIEVVTRGFDSEKSYWRTAEGIARFQGDRKVGSLGLSFAGPFFGAYNVVVLDPDYGYAMVAGPDRSYLWIIARQPELEQSTLDVLLAQAKQWGFATHKLIFVDQTPRSHADSSD